MEELKSAREETETTRQETGAVDTKPGEVEGMRDDVGFKSRAMEKRKREIEERRKLIDAKRQRLKDYGGQPGTSQNGEGAGTGPAASSTAVAGTPKDTKKIASSGKGKEKAGSLPQVSQTADAFLSQLEHDLLGVS